MIEFRCPQCGKRYVTHPRFAGKAIRCQVCSAAIVIPSSPAVETSPAAKPGGANAGKGPPEAVRGGRTFPDGIPSIEVVPSSDEEDEPDRARRVRAAFRAAGHSELPREEPAIAGYLARYQKGMNILSALLFWALVLGIVGSVMVIKRRPLMDLWLLCPGLAVTTVLAYSAYQTRTWVNYVIAPLYGFGLLVSLFFFGVLVLSMTKLQAPGMAFVSIACAFLVGLGLNGLILYCSIGNIRCLRHLGKAGIDPGSRVISRGPGVTGKLALIVAILCIPGGVLMRILENAESGRTPERGPDLSTIFPEESNRKQRTQPTGTKGRTVASLSLVDARRGFKTRLIRKESSREPVPAPPPHLFLQVSYDSAVGPLSAYLSPDPRDGKKHPAIVWITGGDCNSIGDVWSVAPPQDDQTASAFRMAGIIMMFPSLRGGNTNPGFKEGFFGEVDDVLSAADHLARQDYVDPARIYLGGHSTGGTLVLLVAACSDRFRAIFSFGPVEDVIMYAASLGKGFLPFDVSDGNELKVRAPAVWLDCIKSPTFVMEGMRQPCNLKSLTTLAANTKNPLIRFLKVRNANHFDILAPANKLIAGKVLNDDGPASRLPITEAELLKAYRGMRAR